MSHAGRTFGGAGGRFRREALPVHPFACAEVSKALLLGIIGSCPSRCRRGLLPRHGRNRIDSLQPDCREVVRVGMVAGLIPPSTVQTASKCPNGAAKIETQLSFVNQLVAWLTAYIYTPMTIKVTCAQSRRASVSPTAPRIDVGTNPTAEQVKDGIRPSAPPS